MKSEVAISLRRTPLGWQVVTYEIRNGKAVQVAASEPDNRILALETLQREVDQFFRMES